MNKSELIEKIAENADLSKAEAGRALQSFMDAVSGSLAAGEDVALAGFGTFTVKTRAARVGRNPQTGAELQIPEANVPGFKSGKPLKDAVNA